MRRFMKTKSAIMSTEIMLGITLVVIVAFAALGAFDNNVNAVATDSGMKNIYTTESKSEKNNFTAYNRNYSNSQVRTGN